MDVNNVVGAVVGGVQVLGRTYQPMPTTAAMLDGGENDVGGMVEVVTEELVPPTEADAINDTYATCLRAYQQMNDPSEDDPAKVFAFVCYGVLITTIGVLGLAGNIISVIVLSRPKMRSSINCCLIGLSIFDMIVLSGSILMFGLTEISDFTGTMKWYSTFYLRITPFIFPLGLIAQTGSVYLTVTVTVERYVAVCLPLRARSICTYGRAKLYVLGVSLFAVLYNIPRFWEISYTTCEFKETNTTFELMVATDLRQNGYYIQIYITWMYLIFMYLIPFLSLMIFNSFIYREVRVANTTRQRLSRLEKKEIGLAVMLLVVVTVFFVCNVLAFIINILELCDIVIDELTVTSNLLVTVNSSVNFVIYCIFGTKFRRLFLKIFCGRFATGMIRRGTTYRDSGIYSNSTRYTNGRATQIIRLSSYNGSQRGRSEAPDATPPSAAPGSSWRPFSKYTSVPLNESSTPRTASSSFTPSRSPSLVPPSGGGEGDHAL